MTKTLGRKPKQLLDLEVHQLPDSTAYLWEWYDELFNGGKISWQELDAWSRLTRRRILPWEAETIKALDTLYLRVQNDRRC